MITVLYLLLPSHVLANEHGLLYGKTMIIGKTINAPITTTDVLTNGDLNDSITLQYANTSEFIANVAYYEFPNPVIINAYAVKTNGNGVPDVVFYDSNKNELSRITNQASNFTRVEITPVENVSIVSFANTKSWGFRLYEVDVFGEIDPEPDNDKIPPSAPNGLKVINIGDGTASISWNDNTEPDLAGYRIYLNGNLVNDSLITTNQYTFDELTNGNTYTAQISAVDLAGNESELSAGVTFTPEQDKPPEPPKWLKATPGVEEVILTWTANKEPDLNGYYVYRDGGRISSIVSGTTYTDTGLTPGTEYSYYVTAADAAGHESEPSETVTVTTNTEYAIIPPTNVNATPNRSDMEIIVSWSAVPDATTYKIFKNGLIISETSETSYIDRDVEIGQLYKYRIASVIDGEQSSLSKVAQARILEEFDFENPLNFAAPDIVQTAWNFVKTYDQYVILLLGIIFAPVALGLIVWLQKKVPSSPRTRSRAKGVEVNERQ